MIYCYDSDFEIPGPPVNAGLKASDRTPEGFVGAFLVSSNA